MRHNSVVIDTTPTLVRFPHMTMQTKSSASETSAKLQVVLTHDNITVPTMTTNTITAFADHPSELGTTGTVTPVGKFSEAASLLLSHSMSTLFDKKIAVGNTNTRESANSIKRNPQLTEISVVIPEQLNFI